MSRYLVTGGAGFIGSNLAHALLASGVRPGDAVAVLGKAVGEVATVAGAEVEIIAVDPGPASANPCKSPQPGGDTDRTRRLAPRLDRLRPAA